MEPVLFIEGVTFSRLSYFWLFYLSVAWLLVWGVHGLLWYSSRRYRRAPWSWVRLTGVVLLLFPFVRMLNGIYESIEFVATPGTVARTRAPEVWWSIIRRNWVQNFLIPLVGLFLANGHGWRLRSGLGALGGGVRSTLVSVGMWPRVSWMRDVANGLAAFLLIFFGYIMLAVLLSPLRGEDTGDASAVFDAITPLLAIALAVMAGVTEEFLYRGVLLVRMRTLLPRVPAVVLLVASSIIFGLAHAGYGTIANMVFPFLLGLVVGTLALWLGVWPAVIVHSGVNFMIFLSRLDQQWVPLVGYLFLLFALVFPLVYFGILVMRHWTRSRGPPLHGDPDAGTKGSDER